MRILVVATKLPWPPVDGGRLVLWLSLQGLLDAGHAVTLVAPEAMFAQIGSTTQQPAADNRLRIIGVPVRRRSGAATLLASLCSNRALTLVRHRHDALRQVVAKCIEEFVPEVIHVEQLQALANCSDLTRGIPIVLRMQNVESELWRQSGTSGLQQTLLAIEARRVRAAERRAIERCAQTVTLTANDADQLQQFLSPGHRGRVRPVAPAFPPELPAGPSLPGEPAVVLAGSGGWRPNTLGAQWFINTVWPAVIERLPNARLHVMGGDPVKAATVQWHDAPDDSAAAFPAGGIAVVPLAVASGIRMRILEAWARGTPVVATTKAARGLAITNGRELLIADDAAVFASAISSVAADATLRRQLVVQGRAYLQAHHAPTPATADLVAVYLAATGAAKVGDQALDVSRPRSATVETP